MHGWQYVIAFGILMAAITIMTVSGDRANQKEENRNVD